MLEVRLTGTVTQKEAALQRLDNTKGESVKHQTSFPLKKKDQMPTNKKLSAIGIKKSL